MDSCKDTSSWLSSGCLLREVPCFYIVSESLDSKGAEKHTHWAVEDKPEEASNENTSVAARAVKARQSRKSVPDDAHPGPQPAAVPWSNLISPRDREAQREVMSRLTVLVKEGCAQRFAANELLAHQLRECAERFVYCRHGCGTFLKWREQNEHEDAEHLLQTDLHLAVEEGDLERVKDHVEGRDSFRRYAVNCRDEEGNNALHYAVSAGHAHIVRYLLTQGIDANVAGLHGRTALIVAAAAGRLAIAEQLLQAGARVDAPDAVYGWAALHHACFNGHADVVDALVLEFGEASFQVALTGVDAGGDAADHVGDVEIDAVALHLLAVLQRRQEFAPAAAQVQHPAAGRDPVVDDPQVGAESGMVHAFASSATRDR